MNPFRVVEVCGLFPERDETCHRFSSSEQLRAFIRETSLRFADCLADIKHEHSNHDLNALGQEYRGVGYSLTMERSTGEKLSVGVAPENWALVFYYETETPLSDISEPGKLVFYFGEWTEVEATDTYKPDTAWGYIQRWLCGALA